MWPHDSYLNLYIYKIKKNPNNFGYNYLISLVSYQYHFHKQDM